jgi:hypothetical protein
MRIKLLQAAEKAGLVKFEGGELATYGIASPSAGDHNVSLWSVATEQKLQAFIEEFNKEHHD